MKVYRIYGSTGAYSDHTEWTVTTKDTREAAEKLVEELAEWYKNNIRGGGRRVTIACPLDPQFKDYDGDTEWHIEELELS